MNYKELAKRRARDRLRYNLNINGCRDRALMRGLRSSIRNSLLKSLPVEQLLKEVGYYEQL